jgi:hypothetical protein
LFAVWVVGGFIFRLEEEENAALLHHLLKVNAETTVFCSASGLGCRLVEATVQAADSALGLAANIF